jgi:hypothetical protein
MMVDMGPPWVGHLPGQGIIAKFGISHDGKLIKLLLSMQQQSRSPILELAKPEPTALRCLDFYRSPYFGKLRFCNFPK